MSNLKVDGAVHRDVTGAVHRAVTIAVYWAVDGAGAADSTVSRAVVRAVDRAMHRVVHQDVWWAVRDVKHPALKDFLRSCTCGAVGGEV